METCYDFLLSSSVVAVGHEPEKWSVYRRYLEFYVLESKLTEFHGKAFTKRTFMTYSFITYSILFVWFTYVKVL